MSNQPLGKIKNVIFQKKFEYKQMFTFVSHDFFHCRDFEVSSDEFPLLATKEDPNILQAHGSDAFE